MYIECKIMAMDLEVNCRLCCTKLPSVPRHRIRLALARERTSRKFTSSVAQTYNLTSLLHPLIVFRHHENLTSHHTLTATKSR